MRECRTPLASFVGWALALALVAAPVAAREEPSDLTPEKLAARRTQMLVEPLGLPTVFKASAGVALAALLVLGRSAGLRYRRSPERGPTA